MSTRGEILSIRAGFVVSSLERPKAAPKRLILFSLDTHLILPTISLNSLTLKGSQTSDGDPADKQLGIPLPPPTTHGRDTGACLCGASLPRLCRNHGTNPATTAAKSQALG